MAFAWVPDNFVTLEKSSSCLHGYIDVIEGDEEIEVNRLLEMFQRATRIQYLACDDSKKREAARQKKMIEQGIFLCWSHARIAFDGTPFHITRRISRQCQYAGYASFKTRIQHRVRGSYKVGCRAQIKISYITRFPDYSVTLDSDRSTRASVLEKLRGEWQDARTVTRVVCWFPLEDAHLHHSLTDTALYAPDGIKYCRMHRQVKNKIHDLVKQGVRSTPVVQKLLYHYVIYDLCGNDPIKPSPLDPVYFPNKKTICSHVKLAMDRVKQAKAVTDTANTEEESAATTTIADDPAVTTALMKDVEDDTVVATVLVEQQAAADAMVGMHMDDPDLQEYTNIVQQQTQCMELEQQLLNPRSGGGGGGDQPDMVVMDGSGQIQLLGIESSNAQGNTKKKDTNSSSAHAADSMFSSDVIDLQRDTFDSVMKKRGEKARKLFDQMLGLLLEATHRIKDGSYLANHIPALSQMLSDIKARPCFKRVSTKRRAMFAGKSLTHRSTAKSRALEVRKSGIASKRRKSMILDCARKPEGSQLVVPTPRTSSSKTIPAQNPIQPFVLNNEPQPKAIDSEVYNKIRTAHLTRASHDARTTLAASAEQTADASSGMQQQQVEVMLSELDQHQTATVNADGSITMMGTAAEQPPHLHQCVDTLHQHHADPSITVNQDGSLSVIIQQPVDDTHPQVTEPSSAADLVEQTCTTVTDEGSIVVDLMPEANITETITALNDDGSIHLNVEQQEQEIVEVVEAQPLLMEQENIKHGQLSEDTQQQLIETDYTTDNGKVVYLYYE